MALTPERKAELRRWWDQRWDRMQCPWIAWPSEEELEYLRQDIRERPGRRSVPLDWMAM